MTRRVSSCAASAAIMFLVTLYPNAGLAVDKANYSGQYSLQEKKTTAGSEVTLKVVQTDDAVMLAHKSQAQKIKELVKKMAEDARLKKLV